MEFHTYQILAGILVGLIIGLSKTGVPSIAVFGVALMAIIFPTKASVGLILPMLLTGDLVAVSYYRHKVIWKHLLTLVPWILIGLAAGYFVLDWSGNRGLQLLIGLIVLILIILHIVKNRLNDTLADAINGSPIFSAFVGVLAGFTTMVGNAAGGIMTIYLLSKKLDKTSFVGTGAWFYLFVNTLKVPLYATLGIITWHTLLFNLWMVPAILAGAVAGIFVLKYIPERVFQWIILVMAAVGAVRLLWG